MQYDIALDEINKKRFFQFKKVALILRLVYSTTLGKKHDHKFTT